MPGGVLGAQRFQRDRPGDELVEHGAQVLRLVGAGRPRVRIGEHFTLVRQINAEAAHIPRAAIEAWQENGPLRVRRELAGHLRRLSDQGLLRIANADRAAVHLRVLVGVWTTGVHVFLHGYG